MTCYWEHFEHGADIGVRGIGETKPQAFEQAALALTGVITPPENITPLEEIRLECDATDDELLLVEWLNLLIYEIATRKMLFSQFTIEINNNHLTARCRGEPIDIKRHKPVVEIKGATFTELSIRKENNLWIVQTIVDV